ncbi:MULTISPECIES: hypothetical protein [unclassified Nocardioides]|uniref:hypothetical protein n=1 Tax=unclassified Nocardioides TaxID=2615069 RepID=UPI0026664ABD|nr:hypothetical protein [Nocardioides sp. Arc9.136]WKN47277.1 hypothetical protein OSR43_14705 [Nocardioides sp. Arc9.136]
MLNALVVLAAAEESHHEVDHALSWGVGAVALVILLGMMLALVAFGGGREHS